jgi:transposase
MSSTLIEALPTDVDALRDFTVAQLEKRDAQLAERDQRIALLEETVRLLRAEKFGRRSEQQDAIQPLLFNEAEHTLDTEKPEELRDPDTPVAGHTRRKPGRRPLPADLPRIEKILDLPEAEKTCTEHGIALREIGRDTSERLEIIPAKLRVIREIRPKYVCPECEGGGVKSAAPAPQLIPKGIASASLIAYVATSKYCDGLPLYRQEQQFARIGVELGRTTLANWMVRFGQEAEPLLDLLRRDLVSYDILEMDETRFPVLKEPGKKPSSDGYLWAQRGGEAEHPIVVFTYDPSRAGAVAAELLEGFEGYLQTDGYVGYDEAGGKAGIVHVGCFAHARRKFVEALKGGGGLQKKNAKSKRKASKAQRGLEYIHKLYEIERTVRDASAEARCRVRRRDAKPVLDEFCAWLESTEGAVPPKSLTGKAIGYTLRRWSRLIRYLDDGRLRIDTNLVENAIRPFVVGRKAWLFADTVRGAQASANLYSLIETAKANGLEPFAYMHHLADRLPLASSDTELRALLPNRTTPDQLARAPHPSWDH